MNIETINGVEYLKQNGKYYKLTICDVRQINKARVFEVKQRHDAETRRMINYEYNMGMSKKELAAKYCKSVNRINQILKKGCV